MPTKRPNVIPANTTLISVVVVVAVLHFAREVFIPLALAILFTFLLAPLVTRLRHWGLWRMPAIILVVVMAFSLVATIGALVTGQLADLGHKLPEYQSNIRQKVHAIRDSSNVIIRRITTAIQNVSEELGPPTPAQNRPGSTPPVPVEIRSGPVSPLQMGRTILGPLINIMLMAAIVVVFVIFMLMEREAMRDRFIRLLGAGQLNVTTKALDDAAHRVSRYLLAQLFVNVAFGMCAAIGLYLLGIPNPILWGVIAVLLRYIPYLGMWIATLMPAAIAFAIDPSWVKPVLVVGLYFGIDVMMYNFVEPYVYGTSTGITPLGILFAAIFWTWLWGPVGLLLATPLTVCVAVLGRYVPSLRFLSILLCDEPVLSPDKRFYQRLLAGDIDEASEVAEEFLKDKSLEELYDSVILPALILAETDRHEEKLDSREQQLVFDNTRIIIEHMADAAREMVSREEARAEDSGDARRESGPPPVSHALVLFLPARDEADEIAAEMLNQLLAVRGVKTSTISALTLASERLEKARCEQARMVCIVAVPPSGHMHTRYLTKRLRLEFPESRIIAALLTGEEVQVVRQRRPEIPADEFATTLAQTVAGILSLITVKEPAPQAAFIS